jgi:hypothetical protein
MGRVFATANKLLPDFMKSIKNFTVFVLSCMMNALTAGKYKPGNGFTFFHSIGDEVVPYCNFESVRNTWGVNNIVALSYQSKTTLHVGTGTSFFLFYCGDLVDEILKGKWAPREDTVGGEIW